MLMQATAAEQAMEAPREAAVTRLHPTANLTVVVLPTAEPAARITVHNMVAMEEVLQTTIRYVFIEAFMLKVDGIVVDSHGHLARIGKS